MTFKFVLITIISVLCFGQSAKVVPLSPTDAAQIKSLYEKKQQADRQWEEAQQDIKNRYASAWHEETDYGISSISASGSSGTMLIGMSGGVGWASTDGGSTRCDAYIGNEPIDESKACVEYRAKKDALLARQKLEREKAEGAARERIAKLPKKRVYDPLPGWEQGIEFSDGFTFIVPKSAVQVSDPAISRWQGLHNIQPTVNW